MVREPTLKLYFDKACREACTDELWPDFGVVDTGSSKILEIYMTNTARVPTVDIKLEVDNPEVKILSFPISLKVGEVASVVLEWKTDPLLLEGLEGANKGKGTKISGTYKELWK